eukprot:CAMPEP_0182490998 /NCGR_PEP_ID=MMETSP1321-20130603/641_1 /TAXON_ID=91990 /ORGANISM="Bolidomonas sp., Strain RCC1657" /LENGTH=781 /DNA_ID=CAMNT_0024693245 /DNA_START=18 /DNA_END=2360 /DNA_ORIENTATION=-
MSYTYRQPNQQTKSLTPINSWQNNSPGQKRSFKSPIKTKGKSQGVRNVHPSNKISFAKAFGAVPQMSRSHSQQTFQARPQTTGTGMRGSSSSSSLFNNNNIHGGGRPPHPQHFESSNPFAVNNAFPGDESKLSNAQSLLDSAQHQQQQEKLRLQQQELRERQQQQLMARQEQQQQQLLAEQTQSRIRHALDAGIDPNTEHAEQSEPLRRNSNPNLKTTFADNSTVASSDSNSSSQYQPPPMHPSMAFARPSTSQASMQSIAVDPNNAEQLREEVKRLQLAMIDQFRGTNKNRFTGGSQFRAKPTTTDSTDRTAELNSLRTAVKSMRAELRNVKMDNEELTQTSSQDRAARNTLEEQLRKEHQDAVSLKQELDRVRALLEASETRIIKKPVGRPSTAPDNATKILEQRLKEEKKVTEELREKSKKEASRLKIKTEELKETEQRREAESTRWEEERTRLYSEIDRWRKKSTDALSALENGEAQAKKNNRSVEDKLRKLSMRATEKSKRALAEKESELRRLAEEAEALRTSSDKLKELEKEHGKERKKSIAMISKMDQLGLDVEKLKATIELLTKDKEEREKLLALKAEAEFKLREDIVKLNDHVSVQEEEIESLKGRLQAFKEDSEKGEGKAKDKNDTLVQQLSAVTEELRTATQEKVICQNVLNEKVEELHKLEHKVTKERKVHKSNMEQALNSIVRLCVVAPTVNVQMADQTLSFKAPLPREKIRHFVQDQVLPKFATIFQQSADGMSPDGTNLDSWLQNLLVDMQNTIERHLSKVFNSRA